MQFKSDFELVRDGDDYAIRNLTWNREPWRGSIDCPIWQWIDSAARKMLATRRLKDCRAVQSAHPGKSKDLDTYGLMLKRMVTCDAAPMAIAA